MTGRARARAAVRTVPTLLYTRQFCTIVRFVHAPVALTLYTALALLYTARSRWCAAHFAVLPGEKTVRGRRSGRCRCRGARLPPGRPRQRLRLRAYSRQRRASRRHRLWRGAFRTGFGEPAPDARHRARTPHGTKVRDTINAQPSREKARRWV